MPPHKKKRKKKKRKGEEGENQTQLHQISAHPKPRLHL